MNLNEKVMFLATFMMGGIGGIVLFNVLLKELSGSLLVDSIERATNKLIYSIPNPDEQLKQMKTEMQTLSTSFNWLSNSIMGAGGIALLGAAGYLVYSNIGKKERE
jgi:hypothetical protein